jgi:hypothetical protein
MQSLNVIMTSYLSTVVHACSNKSVPGMFVNATNPSPNDLIIKLSGINSSLIYVVLDLLLCSVKCSCLLHLSLIL